VRVSGATMMLTFHLNNQAFQMVSNQFNYLEGEGEFSR
jgi:hypothetical protein